MSKQLSPELVGLFATVSGTQGVSVWMAPEYPTLEITVGGMWMTRAQVRELRKLLSKALKCASHKRGAK